MGNGSILLLGSSGAGLQNWIESGRYHIMTWDVEEVLEVLVSIAKQGPDGAGAFVDIPRLPLTSVVAQEGSVQTRVCMLHQLDLNTRGR